MSAFLDANIVLRYITRDIEDQYLIAQAIIESDELLYLTEGTIGEICFGLRQFYDAPRELIVDSLVGLLQRENIRAYNLDTALVIEALMLCRSSGRVSVYDALLWAVARSAGTNTRVYTLDKHFPRTGLDLRSAP